MMQERQYLAHRKMLETMKPVMRVKGEKTLRDLADFRSNSIRNKQKARRFQDMERYRQ